MLFSFKVALQLNLKQLQTTFRISFPNKQQLWKAGADLQGGDEWLPGCWHCIFTVGVVGIECAPRSSSVVHNSSIHLAWSFFRKQSTSVMDGMF